MSRLSCLLSTLTRFSVHSQLTVLNYSVFPPKLPFRLGSTASLLPSDVLLWAPQQSPPLQESRQAPAGFFSQGRILRRALSELPGRLREVPPAGQGSTSGSS